MWGVGERKGHSWASSERQTGHLRRKGRKGAEREKKRELERKGEADLKAAKCSGGSGRGEEVEEKRLTDESSLAIAKSIHTIVWSDSERRRETADRGGGWRRSVCVLGGGAGRTRAAVSRPPPDNPVSSSERAGCFRRCGLRSGRA